MPNLNKLAKIQHICILSRLFMSGSKIQLKGNFNKGGPSEGSKSSTHYLGNKNRFNVHYQNCRTFGIRGT